MSAVGGIEVPRETGRFTMGTDIDRITNCAMKASTNNIKKTAKYREKKAGIEKLIIRWTYCAHFTPRCLSAE
jgi:hypothetical protein